MKRVDVLYWVEHRDRELDAAASIAALLRHRGRSVRVEPIMNGAFRAMSRYAPRVVVAPFCPSEKTFPLSVLWQAYGESTHYVNLGFEQILADLFTYSHVPRDRFSKEVAYHCAWNDRYRQWLLENGVPDDRIVVTGSPQHAFYLRKYRDLVATRDSLSEQADLPPKSTWALFPFNYGGAFYDQAAKEGMLRKGQPPDLLQAYVDFCHRSLNQALQWIVEEAPHRSDTLFIIRPRPREAPEEYMRRLSAFGPLPGNVVVVKHGPIRDWIVNSQMVFSSYSTTLLDAALAGRTAFSLLPYPLPTWLHKDWNELVPNITDASAFHSSLDLDEKAGPTDALRAYAETQYGTAMDPLVQVTGFIDGLLATHEEAPLARESVAQIRQLRSVTLREAVKRFLTKHGLQVPGRPLPSAYDYFNEDQLEERIGYVQRVVVPASAHQDLAAGVQRSQNP